MLLALQDIGKKYGSRIVLRGISFALYPASVSLLCGPNGAGKSTLLRIMAGLVRPSKGTVQTGNLTLGDIGYLGHTPFIYPSLTALENVRFWQKVHGKPLDEKALLNLLRRVDLHKFADERAASFSRGMLQRLNLARMLGQQPKLLLLDEPGTGLDTASMNLLYKEIACAKAQGACVVWISHSLEQDKHHADRLLQLDKQQLVFDGPLPGAKHTSH